MGSLFATIISASFYPFRHPSLKWMDNITSQDEEKGVKTMSSPRFSPSRKIIFIKYQSFKGSSLSSSNPGFPRECEHIFLIALNSRLIEWIHTEQISADSTCEFEEVE